MMKDAKEFIDAVKRLAEAEGFNCLVMADQQFGVTNGKFGFDYAIDDVKGFIEKTWS